jgi:hypothetical protein
MTAERGAEIRSVVPMALGVIGAVVALTYSGGFIVVLVAALGGLLGWLAGLGLILIKRSRSGGVAEAGDDVGGDVAASERSPQAAALPSA